MSRRRTPFRHAGTALVLIGSWLGHREAHAQTVAPEQDAAAPTLPAADPQTAVGQPALTEPPTPSIAPVEEPSTSSAAASSTDEPAIAGKKKRKKNKKGAESASSIHVDTSAGTFEVRGHAFALAEYQRRDGLVVDSTGMLRSDHIDSLDLMMRGVRVAVRYHDPDDWLSVVLDFRLSDKPKMKNAYVQAKAHHLLARFGQFKMPVSAFEMESSWVLPVVRHGFLHQILVKRLDVGGRRPGAIFGWHGYGKVHPRFTVGAFQGSVVTSESADDRKTDLILASPGRSQSLVARAELEAPGVTVGAYYENRIGSPGPLTTGHFWTAGMDLVIDRAVAGGGVRLWVDAMAGASWFETRGKPADGKDATFVSGRALLGYRFGGAIERELYIEPFGLVGAFDPDVDVAADNAWEGAVGVNVGLWQRARVTLQGELNKAGRNFPTGYFVGSAPERYAVLLQVGAAF